MKRYLMGLPGLKISWSERLKSCPTGVNWNGFSNKFFFTLLAGQIAGEYQ